MADRLENNGAFKNPIYAVGAQRPRKVDEWHQYEKGVVVCAHAPEKVEVCHSYVSPPSVCPEEQPSIGFKTGTLVGDKLYVCTATEVITYEFPSFRQIHYVSLPCFNDLHHATPNASGNILVVNTGLDMLVEVTPDGEIVNEWGTLGQDVWQRFSRETDYRRIPTTKPHHCHPNFVCEVDGEYWVNRAAQKDCVPIPSLSRRVSFPGPGHTHDGVSAYGRIYFTATHGAIAIVNEATMMLEQHVDLNGIGHEDAVLGWCRGIHPVSPKLFWVAFTRIRNTKFRENVSWVVHGFRQYYLPTRIALYDIEARTLLQEIDLEPYGMNAIFSLHSMDTGIAKRETRTN